MKPSLRISILASPLMMVFGLLASGPLARAQSRPCSNRTLAGYYGFTIEGQILGGPFAGPLRGVAMTYFSGDGKLSQVDHVLLGGTPPPAEWSPAVGTYTVNPDCTGAAQLIFSDGRPPVNLRFVVVKSGTEIHTVVADPGFASTSLGIRRDGPPL